MSCLHPFQIFKYNSYKQKRGQKGDGSIFFLNKKIEPSPFSLFYKFYKKLILKNLDA